MPAELTDFGRELLAKEQEACRIIIDALAAKVEHYRAEARYFDDVAKRKPSSTLREQAAQKRELANTAERIRNQIKEA